MKTHIIKTLCPCCQRQLVYWPYYKKDYEIFERRKRNVVYTCDIKQPRNSRHHRLIFGLATICLENYAELDEYGNRTFWGDYYIKNPETAVYNFIKAVMLDAKIFDLVPNRDGTWRQDVKSISFDKMDEIEFKCVSDAMFEEASKSLRVDVDWLHENYEIIFEHEGL